MLLQQTQQPRPVEGPGVRDKWHRRKLDEDVARRHGIRVEAPIVEDVTELI
jgi:hypothetical protein